MLFILRYFDIKVYPITEIEESSMKRILFLRSSLFNGDGASSQLGDEFVAQLTAQYPDSRVTILDLARNPLPHLSADEFNSWVTAEEERSVAQRELAAISDRLLDQLFDHDILVFAVPLYNLGIPSTLKAWIDRVARAGKTFRYTSNGPQGLLGDKQAYLLFARGGIYRDTPLDTQTPYLKSILGLMGITAVETVYAEGLNMGEEKQASALDEARSAIKQLLTVELPEVRYAIA